MVKVRMGIIRSYLCVCVCVCVCTPCTPAHDEVHDPIEDYDDAEQD